MKNSREVKIGNLTIGGKNPIRIKGMVKCSLSSEKELIREVQKLEKEGAEAIRIAVREREDSKIYKLLRKVSRLPLVADIHFTPSLALLAIDNGFEGIRLNPLNITKKKDIKRIIKSAKERKVSIRVGINSGGFRRDFSSPTRLASSMVSVVRRYLRIFEEEGFFDIIVSLKASSVWATVLANRIFRKETNYPLHVGVTATGPFMEGIIKSSLGMGILLSEGIGDVIRVSLTGPSWEEIKVAKLILQFLDLRSFFPEIISCPTCSRCEVDIRKIAENLRKFLDKESISSYLKIAVMGCIVNGPGEAHQADVGVAFGKKRGVIFKEGRILKAITEKNAFKELSKAIKDVV